MKIIITKIGESLYKAYVENDPGCCETGHTSLEALGGLIFSSLRDRLNLQVHDEEYSEYVAAKMAGELD